MNLGQFRAAIDRRTGVFVDPTAQNEWINNALNRIAGEERWPWLEKTTTVTLVAGTNSYTLPTDVRTIYSAFDAVNSIVYDQASIRDLVSFSRSDDLTSSFGIGYWYGTDGASLFIAPTPVGAGTLTVRYFATETPLVSDPDVPLLPAVYHEAVVVACASETMQRQASTVGNPRFAANRANMFEGTYNALIMKMKREALRRTGQAMVPRIRPGAAW